MPARDQVVRREVRELFSVGAVDGTGGMCSEPLATWRLTGPRNLYVLDRLTRAAALLTPKSATHTVGIARHFASPSVSDAIHAI